MDYVYETKNLLGRLIGRYLQIVYRSELKCLWFFFIFDTCKIWIHQSCNCKLLKKRKKGGGRNVSPAYTTRVYFMHVFDADLLNHWFLAVPRNLSEKEHQMMRTRLKRKSYLFQSQIILLVYRILDKTKSRNIVYRSNPISP